MAQYRAGKASVTNGSAVVTGTGTSWISNVSRGDAFTIAGTSVIYDVADVQSDTQLTLTAPYSGTTVSEFTYAIARDFTSPDNFPELVSGDIETPTILTRAIRKIQQKFNTMADGGFTEAVRLANLSTLDLDFAHNTYKLYEGLTAGITNKTFDQVLTHTRGSVANAHDALGAVSTAAAGDHRLVGNREGLLVEYGKTNLVVWSEDYTQTAWSKSGTSISTGQDPDSPAQKLVENTSTGSHSLSQSVSLTSGNTYTYSALIKAAGRRKITMEQGGVYNPNVFKFDVLLGTVDSQGDPRNYIKNVGEGWWLAVITSEAGSSGSGVNTVELNNDSGDRSYTGDGSSGAFVWGQMLELGDTASSYIESGSTQGTRSADQVSRTFAGEFNNSSGTLYANIDLGSFTDSGGAVSRIMEISNGTTTGRISIVTSAGGSVDANINLGGTTYNITVPNSDKNVRIAVSYTMDSVLVACNGSVDFVSTTTRTQNFSELRLGWSVVSGSMLGIFRSVWYLPMALPATDLANATV